MSAKLPSAKEELAKAEKELSKAKKKGDTKDIQYWIESVAFWKARVKQ